MYMYTYRYMCVCRHIYMCVCVHIYVCVCINFHEKTIRTKLFNFFNLKYYKKLFFLNNK